MSATTSAAAVSLLLAFASGWAWAGTSSLSFKYPDGAKGKTLGLRTHETVLPEVSGEVYVYATFDMCPANPFPYEDGLPKFVRDAANKASGSASFEEEPVREKKAAKGVKHATRLQVVTLGRKTGDEFVPVIKFGLVDDGRKGKNTAFITPWVHGGGLDYYSLFARPNTPYDYRIHLDLEAKRMTVWVSGRGDDKWYLIAKNAPMVNDGIKVVNHLLVKQHPGAAGIRDLRVVAAPYAAAEEIQSHPLAKKDRVVGPGRGFRFQSMRSVWGRPGRHVTIRRNPPRWHGFPDVCQVDKNTLACVYVDGAGHGGGGGIFCATQL